jgi:predicted secreted hydrolase
MPRVPFALRAALVATLLLGGLAAQESRRAFRGADRPRTFAFPADHGSHPDHRVEWWYVTGRLDADDGATYGFQFTVFRAGLPGAPESRPSRLAARDLWFGHLALTDVRGGRFLHDERASRGMLGSASAAVGGLDVRLDDWTFRAESDGAWRIVAASTGDVPFALDLRLRPAKPPVLHGAEPGLSRKGALPTQSSYYVSLTRLDGDGALTLDGRQVPVRCGAWFDHEFGSDQLAEDVAGWDWFALRFDDGADLMLYRLRRSDGSTTPWSSGTFVAPDGRTTHLAADAARVVPTGSWKSPRSGATYPSGWRIEVPSLALVCDFAPLLTDQELTTDRSTRVVYWEGACDGAGTREGRRVAARAYVELTGYAGPVARF